MNWNKCVINVCQNFHPASSYQYTTDCKPLTQQIRYMFDSSWGDVPTYNTENSLQSAPSPLVILLSLEFTSTLQQVSVSSPLVSCIIHSRVQGLSPISCLINKTYLCACSLTSPSSRLIPETKPWAHAELMKAHRWMAISNWEKITTIQAISRLRELCV